MNIEIIEFYPIERNENKETLTGTLRIKLRDLGIHILGIYVSKKKNFWFFRLPGNQGTHHETGEAVRYPAVVFEDKKKQYILMEGIKEKGRAFIERQLAKQPQPKQKQPPVKDIIKAPKETMAKEKLLFAIAEKEWREPPPLKSRQVKKSSKLARK